MDGMVEDEECEDQSPGYPYIEFGTSVCYKEEVPPTEGSRA